MNVFLSLSLLDQSIALLSSIQGLLRPLVLVRAVLLPVSPAVPRKASAMLPYF